MLGQPFQLLVQKHLPFGRGNLVDFKERCFNKDNIGSRCLWVLDGDDRTDTRKHRARRAEISKLSPAAVTAKVTLARSDQQIWKLIVGIASGHHTWTVLPLAVLLSGYCFRAPFGSLMEMSVFSKTKFIEKAVRL